MIASTNFKVIPFFDRVPVRARAIVRRTCDLILMPNAAPDLTHKIMCADLSKAGIEPPTLDEFKVWFAEVQLRRFGRADYADMPTAQPLQRRADDTKPLENIIVSAAQLLNGKDISVVRRGRNYANSQETGEIITEALQRWLRSKVPHDTVEHCIEVEAGKIALEMLDAGDASNLHPVAAISSFYTLTRDAQPELCDAIARVVEHKMSDQQGGAV